MTKCLEKPLQRHKKFHIDTIIKGAVNNKGTTQVRNYLVCEKSHNTEDCPNCLAENVQDKTKTISGFNLSF